MKQVNIKKLILPNLPYFLIGLYASKLGEAWRMAEGAELSDKFMNLMDGFAAAFASPFPSFYPPDFLVGVLCGAALRLAVYVKGKNDGVHNFKCKGSLYGRTGGYAHD